MTKLALVPIHDVSSSIPPAAMYEVAAAKYIMVNIASFRDMVRQGIIPARSHEGRVKNIYLREDLDAYLRALRVKNKPNGVIVPFDRGRQTDEVFDGKS